jgi:hypothetical protein
MTADGEKLGYVTSFSYEAQAKEAVQCDGQRPVCSNCQGKTDHCEYRDEGGPSKESTDLVVEVLRILGQMPTTEALEYIEGLKDEEDALTILSTLRKGLSCRLAEVDNSTTVPVSDDDNKPTLQEWQIQSPIAYPGTAGRDTNLFQKDPYRGLTRSPSHNFHADT